MWAKWAKRAVMVLVASAALSQPLLAQTKTDGYKFLDAVKKRDGNAATELLDQPGNTLVSARDLTSGENAMHIVTQRRDLTWMKWLLGKGANPNLADKKGVTPLQIAVQLGFVDGVEVLIDNGADVDVASMTGETPLIAAVHRRDVPMIRMLVSKGANVDRTDNSGRSARDYAKLLGPNSPVLSELERSEQEKSKGGKTYGPN